MNLSSLPSITKKNKKILGRGHGSGRGKTSGRGTKGQKARRKIPLFFEGGALPLIKRLPFRRGKNKNKVFKPKPIIINLKALQLFPKNTEVNLESLVKYNFINAEDAKLYGVKILGEGELSNPLTIKIPVSKNAKIKIEKVGGKVE